MFKTLADKIAEESRYERLQSDASVDDVHASLADKFGDEIADRMMTNWYNAHYSETAKRRHDVTGKKVSHDEKFRRVCVLAHNNLVIMVGNDYHPIESFLNSLPENIEGARRQMVVVTRSTEKPRSPEILSIWEGEL